MTDLTAYPVSSVPAAFDRGHLYSPTLDQTRYALDERYAYDYRPGDLFEPMPDAPRGNSAAWGRWYRSAARIEVPDFLGLRAGDAVTVQHVAGAGPGRVIATYRHGALIRYPLPVSDLTDRTHDETYFRRRNADGHWY